MIYTYVATALIAGAVAATGAWRVQSLRFDALEKQALQAQADKRRADEKVMSAAANNFESDKLKNENRTRTITREVEKIVERPVYRSECFDADGLRTLNSAIGRADGTGQPNHPLPQLAAGS